MKKVFALLILALVMCCCHNNQPQKTEKPVNTPQETTSVKTNKEQYPDKFTGMHIIECAQNFLNRVPGAKMVKTVAIIDDSIAKVKLNYNESDHELVMKFVDGDWVLVEIDGVAPNNE